MQKLYHAVNIIVCKRFSFLKILKNRVLAQWRDMGRHCIVNLFKIGLCYDIEFGFAIWFIFSNQFLQAKQVGRKNVCNFPNNKRVLCTTVMLQIMLILLNIARGEGYEKWLLMLNLLKSDEGSNFSSLKGKMN